MNYKVYKMKRIYYLLLLVGVLGMASCSSDDPEEDTMIMRAPSTSGTDGTDGQGSGSYVSRLLAPPGYERGVGYCYATGAEYLEGVTFNIFNLNYLDSIQYVKGLNLVSDDYTPYSEEQVITGETRSAVSKQLAISASVGANFIVADIKVSGNYSKGSVQESESVFAMKRTKRVAYSRDLQYKNVIMYYKETGDSMIFAPGFYADWKKLEGNGVIETLVFYGDCIQDCVIVLEKGRGWRYRTACDDLLQAFCGLPLCQSIDGVEQVRESDRALGALKHQVCQIRLQRTLGQQ